MLKDWFRQKRSVSFGPDPTKSRNSETDPVAVIREFRDKLGISVYTVNDHLSEARKHLGASNSRTAARLFADFEGALPKNEGPYRLGVSPQSDHRATFALSDAWRRRTLAGGLIVILFSVALIGFLFGEGGN